jgi:nitrogen fixation protein NifQ
MDVYQRLMADGQGERFDRHVFACILAIGAAEAPRKLTEAVGLPRPELEALLHRYFAGAQWLLETVPFGSDSGEDALEEPDLRQLLLDHATEGGTDAERWLAAMVARRSLHTNHLWQDLGLPARKDLSGLMLRHFGALAARNAKDMKWKKFFYRTLCETEGVIVCKSPVCEECEDFDACFGKED